MLCIGVAISLLAWRIDGFRVPVSMVTATKPENYWVTTGRGVPSGVLKKIQQEPWRGGLEGGKELTRQKVNVVEGSIPAQLQGTLYRNGSGRLRKGDHVYSHWFDGDGYITKMELKNGESFYQASYVKTDVFQEQEATGEPFPKRRVFTNRKGGILQNILRPPSPAANTSVGFLGGRLHALFEGALPLEIDSNTLQTKEFNDFDGLVKSYFSAHPKVDPDTGDVFNLGLSLTDPPLTVNLMHIDNKGKLVKQKTAKVGDASRFVHDYGITKDYMVLVIPPWEAPLSGFLSFLAGVATLGGSYKWEAEKKNTVAIFRRDTLELACSLEVPANSFYHTVNAYQRDSDGAIVFQYSAHIDRPAVEKQFGDMYGAHFDLQHECHLRELVIDVKTQSVLEDRAVTPDPISAQFGYEYASVDPRYVSKQHNYMFCNSVVGESPGFLDCISILDLKSGKFKTRSFGKGKFAGEPVFVPRSPSAPEADGYILSYVYDSQTHTSQLAILDTHKFETGPPQAIIQLPSHAPHSFHGVWRPAA